MRIEMESRLPLSQVQRRKLNRALAAALRSYGLNANGEVWEQAKSIMASGMKPKAAARLTRSLQDDDAQREAIAKAREQGAATRPTKMPVVQAATSELTIEDCYEALAQGRTQGLVSEEGFSELLEALVTAEAADLDSEGEVVLSSRAIDVREGRVRRDEKGRLLPN